MMRVCGARSMSSTRHFSAGSTLPHLGRPLIFGVAPIDYGPVFLLMPFGFHLAMDTLPSGVAASRGSRSALAVSSFRFRARLGFSIPPALSGRRGVTPAFGYDTPHPSIGGTLTLLNNARLSAHYSTLRLPIDVHVGLLARGLL
jgi:hypothetical protein